MSPSKFSFPKTARPEHFNAAEPWENNFIKMIEVLKEKIEKSLNKMEEKTTKILEEINLLQNVKETKKKENS